MQLCFEQTLSNLCTQLEKLSSHIAIITDENVAKLHAQSMVRTLQDRGIKALLIPIIPGEKSKTRATKEQIEDALLQEGFGRDLLIVGLGGGVITDLAGFVAATYMRGVRLALVPTSLMAMVDAAIGGKNGVNTKQGKNLIGSFYMPTALFLFPAFLKTLPEDQLRAGFSEIIKTACILDDSLFEKLKSGPHPTESIIHCAIEHKRRVVEKDPKEAGLRRILNFGHTFAHGLERAKGFALSHGDAVGMGMLAEARIAVKMGYLCDDDYEALKSLLILYGFTLGDPSLDKEAVLQAIKMDKKNKSQIPRLVLIDRIGHVLEFDGAYCTQVNEELMEETVEELIHGRL